MGKGLRWDRIRQKPSEIRCIADEDKWTKNDTAARWLRWKGQQIKDQKRQYRRYKKTIKKQPYKDDIALEVLQEMSNEKPPWED